MTQNVYLFNEYQKRLKDDVIARIKRLDLQSEQDLKNYISKKGIAYQALGMQWKINSDKGFSLKSKPVHPGQLLSNKFILPSKISRYDWSRYFCVNRQYLNELLKGNAYLTIQLIATISRAFGTKPEYWIRIQNQFIAWKCEKGLKKKRSKRVGVSGISKKRIHPGEILHTHYLKPLKWEKWEFAKHSGLRIATMSNIIEGKKSIDAQIELKLNQALGTPPMFWTNLQIEWDFYKATKLRANKIQF
jgi:addiction module HigA family antidote